MRYNLKNRPYKLPSKRGAYGEAVQEWFDGFEKELREIDRELADRPQDAWIFAKRKFIKEILDE